MTPVYLTFPDEATAETVLADYPGLQIANPAPMPVCRLTGATDPDGAPVSVPVPGYPVNALAPDGADLSGLDAWRRYPETPWAVWAGV